MSKELNNGQNESPTPTKTSRLIVKSIPKHVTEARLKTHFEQLGGVVTDLKIMKTETGKSRLFGFVGFATVSEAEKAQQHFHKTFLDTSRMSVEFARPKGDSTIPRAWSRYSVGSSKHTEIQKNKKEKEDSKQNKKRSRDEMTPMTSDSVKTDQDEDAALMTPSMLAKKRKLEEFLGMGKKSKGKIWANDGEEQFEDDSSHSKSKPISQGKLKNSMSVDSKSKEKENVKKLLKEQHSSGEESDDDEYQDFFKSKAHSNSDSKMDIDHDNDTRIKGDDGDMEVEDYASSQSSNSSNGSAPNAEDQDDDFGSMVRNKEDDKSTSDHSDSDGGKNSNSKNSVKRQTSSKDSSTHPEEEGDGMIVKKSQEIQESKGNNNKKYKEISPDIVADTGRLFVRNLPFNATEEDVKHLFSAFGTVSEVHISIDKLSKRSKGYGFVLFMFPTHAIEAAKQLDGKVFQGRILHILPAEEQPESANTNHEDGSERSGFVSEYQKKKADRRREMASEDFNWNSLFIRPDAIASAMANNLNVSKGSILDSESSSSMAVRLALGETNIIKETKEFLASEGISLDTLKGHYNKKIERSTKVILVKNIAVSTQTDELRNLFGKFGTLTRVVMAPSRTVSIIEFSTSSEARAAFKGLAYKQFKDAPLYLEWAPIGLFGEESTPMAPVPDDPDNQVNHMDNKNKLEGTETQKKEETEAKPSSSNSQQPLPSKADSVDQALEEASLTLFVKNLSWSTSEDSLRKLVEGLVGSVNNVSIATHVVKGEVLSRGYGFVEFKTRDQALKGWKKMQAAMLDGHQLQVNFSQKRDSTTLIEIQKATQKRKSNNSSKDPTTKLMIKNVPFEATRKEIRELFAPFGELRTVRLPSKPGGKGHRGFAFVEYVTPEESTNAMESLANTHLYNRRLVIDFANEDDDIEAIRSKTAAQFGS